MREQVIFDNVFAKYEKNTFARHNGIVLKSVGKDCAQASMKIGPNSCNPYGYVHGGAYCTLADMCCGSAARSDGREYVTQNSSMTFIKAVKEGELHASAKVFHRGKKVCSVEAWIHNEEEQLVFQGIFNFFCITD